MTRAVLVILAIFLCLTSCTSRKDKLKQELSDILGKQEGTFAVAFHDMQTNEEVLINEHESFHAASTMKTPVLVEVFKQVSEGRFSYSDSILIKTEFSSIVDGSPFSLDSSSDSEHGLYRRVGQKRPLSELVEMMITKSSNLATNLIIEKVGAKNVTATMRTMGLKDLQVLRGVEDSKAFAKGMNNSVTAFDLMMMFEKIASGQAVNKESSDSMIQILLEQEFNTIIPAKLPADVKVAHKTGWITGVHHDSGIVFLPDGRSYVLVLLSKGLKDEKAGIDAMAATSEKIYQFMLDDK